MNIFRGLVVVASLMSVYSTTMAEASGPDFYRVFDVAPNDVLNMRTGPSARYPKVGELPFDANGLANLGCIGGLTLAQWAQATAEERAASRHRRWCLIGFERRIAWVAGRYLAEGGPPDGFNSGSALRRLAGSEWRVAQLGATTVEAESFVTFRSEGRLSGHGGCNRLTGSYKQDGGALSIGPVAMTRMNCEQGIMDVEQAFVAALEASSRFVARHLVLGLLDDKNEIVAQFRRMDFD